MCVGPPLPRGERVGRGDTAGCGGVARGDAGAGPGGSDAGRPGAFPRWARGPVTFEMLRAPVNGNTASATPGARQFGKSTLEPYERPEFCA